MPKEKKLKKRKRRTLSKPKKRTPDHVKEEQYEVEIIKKARVTEKKTWEYLVSWSGYDTDEDSYVNSLLYSQLDHSLQSVISSSENLEVWLMSSPIIGRSLCHYDFWRGHKSQLSFLESELGGSPGIQRDERDPPEPGTVLTPTNEWIEEERAYFHQAYVLRLPQPHVQNNSEDDEFLPLESSEGEFSEPLREPRSQTARSTIRLHLPNRSSKRQPQSVQEDSDSEEIDEVIRPRKRKRVVPKTPEVDGAEEDEDDEDDDDDVPLTELKAFRDEKMRPSANASKSAALSQPTETYFDITSLSINDSTFASEDPSPPMKATPTPSNMPSISISPKPKPPHLFIPSSSTHRISTSTSFQAPPFRKKTDKGKEKEKPKPMTLLPTPSSATPANSGLTTKRRLAESALNLSTPKEIIAELDKKRYESFKFKKLDPAEVAMRAVETGPDEIREKAQDAGWQQSTVDEDPQMHDSSWPLEQDSWRTDIYSPDFGRSPLWPTRTPEFVPSTSLLSPPPTPVMERTMTSFNARPSPSQSPVIEPKYTAGDHPNSSRSDQQERGRVDGFDDFDSFRLDDHIDGSGLLGFKDLEPAFEDLFLDLANDVSCSALPVKPAEIDQQAEAARNPPIPVTPKSRKLEAVDKPNFFFSPRKRLPATHRPWKWSGRIRLFMEVQLSSVVDRKGRIATPSFEELCDAALVTTTPVVRDGMSFMVAMSSTKALDLKMFNVHALCSILPACKKVQQVAVLREVLDSRDDTMVNGEEDVTDGALKKLGKYMISQKMIPMVEFYLDQRPAGIIIFIPPNMRGLLEQLGIPIRSASQCSFIAALLPWSLPPIPSRGEPTKNMWENPSSSSLTRIPVASMQTEPKSSTEMGFREKLRFLRFPSCLLEVLQSGTRKPYYIFSDAHPSKEVDLECKILQSILQHPSLARQTKYITNLTEHRNSVRLVFLHAASLPDLHILPFLADLKRKKCEEGALDVGFYLFGSSSAVDRNQWRFEEVYCLGGVVTFTPLALAKNPDGLSRIFQRVSEHPLWVGYVIPSVIGLAVKLHYGALGLDVMKEFDNGTFIFNSLLSDIDNGILGLLRAPAFENRDDWVLEQADSVLRDPRDTLEYCLQDFERRYDHIPESEWIAAVELELTGDLRKMHVQPIIMDNYRRMVVLTSAGQENHNSGGLEWVNCDDFRFDDDNDDMQT
ncbi:hypothetical protein D9758_008088 [Tetrapyrgos nigripes]|uniref:Chromo domain-containing protein n=1 Tax=Tetrapyrgos nigripes TaxID=182062 RepID=A0A8H5GHK3_9AGAR|nr:hypothetical protein D9758_008088 [Tetrapyrgos nigripes]